MAQGSEQADHDADFSRLESIAARKRTELAIVAQSRRRTGQLLTFLAGFLALLSAGSMTAIIAELATSLWTKVLVALLSLASGTITLLIATYFDQNETRRMWEGAAKYLALRDQAWLTAKSKLGKAKGLEVLTTLQAQYASLSQEYDHYIKNLVVEVASEPSTNAEIGSGAARSKRQKRPAQPQRAMTSAIPSKYDPKTGKWVSMGPPRPG